MCHWYVTRVLTLLLRVLQRPNRFGPEGFCSAWTSDSNAIWSIAICLVPRGTCLWHVARDLTNLLLEAGRLIRFGPDRRRSTQKNGGSVFVSMPGCSRNGTWHVPNSLTKLSLERKLVSRSRRGKQHSTLLYEGKAIRSVAPCFV